MRRVEVSPAALGSLGLHLAIALALMISWNSRDLKVGSVVPVNIVANAPSGEPSPAEQAAETQSAMTEQPAPDAPPEPPVAPPIPPTPTPPKAVAEKAPAPTPAPTKTPAKPQKSLDLDSLYASLTRPARNAPQKPSAGQQGPSRAETAPTARQGAGSSAAAAAAVAGLEDELQRRWNPNCDVEGGREVAVRVTFQLGAGGQVVGNATPEIKSAHTPVAQAGAERAVRAVYAAAPFRGLPREFYGDRIVVNFNAREACAR